MITRRARERWMELRGQLNNSGLSRREVARMGLLTASGVLLGADGRPGAGADNAIPRADFPPSPPTQAVRRATDPTDAGGPRAADTAGEPRGAPVLRPLPGAADLRFNTRSLTHVFHPDLPQPSLLWGYDGQHPGPLIDARYGQPIVIRIVNNLPTLAAHRGFGIPQIITHLHNFHTASESDGGPWDWYGTGQFKDHHYTMARAGFTVPNTIPPQFRDASGGDMRETLTTLFFHDHRADFTAANVYRGLFGFMRLFDERDTGNERDASPAGVPAAERPVRCAVAARRPAVRSGDGRTVLRSVRARWPSWRQVHRQRQDPALHRGAAAQVSLARPRARTDADLPARVPLQRPRTNRSR